jgi:hypothetical protein
MLSQSASFLVATLDSVVHTRTVKFYFTRSSRRHKIGRAHALAALARAGAPTLDDKSDLEWTAADDRGVELHIVGFVAEEDPNLVVIKHVFPTALKEKRK